MQKMHIYFHLGTQKPTPLKKLLLREREKNIPNKLGCELIVTETMCRVQQQQSVMWCNLHYFERLLEKESGGGAERG